MEKPLQHCCWHWDMQELSLYPLTYDWYLFEHVFSNDFPEGEVSMAIHNRPKEQPIKVRYMVHDDHTTLLEMTFEPKCTDLDTKHSFCQRKWVRGGRERERGGRERECVWERERERQGERGLSPQLFHYHPLKLDSTLSIIPIIACLHVCKVQSVLKTNNSSARCYPDSELHVVHV